MHLFCSEVEESTKEVLQKWNEYYINNNFGLGIQCDQCGKWRKVFQYPDKSKVPEIWICSMWKISKYKRGNCRMPSSLTEEDFSSSQYVPGDLVYAKVDGYPWWPAMIEDSPDDANFYMSYLDSEDEYHANFFGKQPLRNWIRVSKLKDFASNDSPVPKSKGSKKLRIAIEEAKEASKMPLEERLLKFSFTKRFAGKWGKIKTHEAILPPEIKQEKKCKGSKPKPVSNKSQIDQDQQTPTVSKSGKDMLKVRSASKRKSAEADVPMGNQGEKNINSTRHFPDIGDPVNKEKQQSSVKSEQLNVSKKQRTSQSRPEVCKKQMKKPSASNQKEESDKNNTLKDSRLSSLKEESNHSQTKESSNGGETLDLMFVSDVDENNHSNETRFSKDTEKEHMFENNHPLITDENSLAHDVPKLSYDSEDDDTSSPNLKAYKEYLNKLIPPITFDSDSDSPDADAGDICSNSFGINSKINTLLDKESVDNETATNFLYDGTVNNDENASFLDNGTANNDENATFLDNGTVNNNEIAIFTDDGTANNDENATFTDNGTANNDENATFTDNEPAINDDNATTYSENEPVSNGGNGITFSNHLPVIKDEVETSFSDNELFIDDENETSFSDNERVEVNCKTETVVNDENSVTFPKYEAIVKEENETCSDIKYVDATTVTANKFVFNDENTFSEDTPIANDENTSSGSETIIIDDDEDPYNEPVVINENNATNSANYLVLNREKEISVLVQGANFPVGYSESSLMRSSSPETLVVPEMEQYSIGCKRVAKKRVHSYGSSPAKDSKYMPYSYYRKKVK